MKSSRLILPLLLGILFLGSAVARTPKDRENYKWDFDAMCRMDLLGLWVGGGPEDLSISPEAAEGKGSIEASVHLDSGEFVRIEHLFIDGFADVGANLHSLNGHDVDLSDKKSIRFSYKSDLNHLARLIFRLSDHSGGWLEWQLPGLPKSGSWQSAMLAIPPEVSKNINLKSAGGVSFELRAQGGGLDGRLWLDDLSFLDQPSPGAISPVSIEPPASLYGPAIHSPRATPRAAARPAHTIMFVNNSRALSEANTALAVAQLRESIARFHGMDIEFWFYPGEAGMFMDPNAPESKEKLPKIRQTTLDVARWCEANRVKFYLGPGHVIPIIVKADWMKEILDAAPTCCLGVFMHEYSPEGNGQLEEVLELLELLKTRGKVMILNNQTSYWFAQMLPEYTVYRNKVFSGRYQDVFVPMWENLLPGAQGLCLGSCLGFWRAGRVASWGVSCQAWTYANLNLGLTDQMPAHWWLRMFVSSVACGANYIEIEPDWPFNGHLLSKVPEGGFLLKLDEKVAKPFGQDSAEMKALRWFQELLMHGALLTAASVDDAASLSPVALQVVKGPGNGQWGIFERGVDKTINQSYCPTAWDMACQPSRGDIFRQLYRSMQHYDQTIPQTPYGLISILPPEQSPGGIELLKTDGRGLFYRDHWLTPEHAEPVVRKAFIKASGKLPITAEGCMIAVTRVGKDDYQAVLMDSEERFPRGVEASVRVNLEGVWQATDAISGERLGECGRGLKLAIPAGAFRIIRISPSRN